MKLFQPYNSRVGLRWGICVCVTSLSMSPNLNPRCPAQVCRIGLEALKLERSYAVCRPGWSLALLLLLAALIMGYLIDIMPGLRQEAQVEQRDTIQVIRIIQNLANDHVRFKKPRVRF